MRCSCWAVACQDLERRVLRGDDLRERVKPEGRCTSPSLNSSLSLIQGVQSLVWNWMCAHQRSDRILKREVCRSRVWPGRSVSLFRTFLGRRGVGTVLAASGPGGGLHVAQGKDVGCAMDGACLALGASNLFLAVALPLWQRSYCSQSSQRACSWVSHTWIIRHGHRLSGAAPRLRNEADRSTGVPAADRLGSTTIQWLA